jgi:hypothetical protein
MEMIMTNRIVSRLSSVLIPAVFLFSGVAMSMPLTAQDQMIGGNRVDAARPLQEARIYIKHGCPYNLDKVCDRRGGKLVCHCVS